MARYRDEPEDELSGDGAEVLLGDEAREYELEADLRGEAYRGEPPLGERLRRLLGPFGAVPAASVYPGAQVISHGNYGYPYRGSARRLAIGGTAKYHVSILLVLHITGNSRLPTAQGEVTYSARSGSTASFTFCTNRSGVPGAAVVQALDPLRHVPWTNGDSNRPNMSLATVARIHDGNPYSANEFCLATMEQVGYPDTAPVSNPYQEELAARVAAWLYKLAGGRIPITRETVITHSDINSVTRARCAVPMAAKEAYLGRVIKRARVLAGLAEPTEPGEEPTVPNLVTIKGAYRLGRARFAAGADYGLFKPTADPSVVTRKTYSPDAVAGATVDGPWAMTGASETWWRTVSGGPGAGWFLSNYGTQATIREVESLADYKAKVEAWVAERPK